MKRFAISWALIAFVSLAGCSTLGGTTGTATPQTQVFAIKQNYATVLGVAVAYVNLPSCATAAPATLCSTPETRVRVKQAKDVASPAIAAAEAAVRDPTFSASATSAAVAAANQAVIALTAITAALPHSK